MRVRYMKENPEILAASRFVEEEPAKYQGKWKEHMGKEELCLEIGCGLGRFIGEMGRRNPHQAWIGLERIGTVLAKAVQRFARNEETKDLTNVQVVRGDAHDLLEYFAPGEVDRIYLNFSDPWPKERHAKRRLTSTKFLPIYKTILKQGGILQMKTDNDNLYAFSLETLKSEGWTIIRQSEDLHNSPYVEGNVMTEYETHFHELGKNINYFQALPPEK